MLHARGIRDAVVDLMLSLCLALALAQVAPEADAPVQPTLTPAEDAPVAALPTQPPQDPKKTARILLTAGAGIAGAGAALGAMVLFSNIRSSMSGAGASFDLVFGTAALGSLLVAGVGFAAHQALGGRGEVGLAALASVACMALTGLAIGTAQVDQLTGAVMVAAIGAIPAAVSVTAILEATGALGGNARGRVW